MTGVKDLGLNEAVDYLQRYPMDLINWQVINSRRKDISFIAANFRRQAVTEVLPPDELPLNRHNANLFELDGGTEAVLNIVRAISGSCLTGWEDILG